MMVLCSPVTASSISTSSSKKKKNEYTKGFHDFGANMMTERIKQQEQKQEQKQEQPESTDSTSWFQKKRNNQHQQQQQQHRSLSENEEKEREEQLLHFNKKSQPLRIKFITTPFEDVMNDSSTTTAEEKVAGQLVLDTVLPSIQEQFAETISVEPLSSLSPDGGGGIDVPSNICSGVYRPYFESYYTTITDADVVIIVSSYTTVTDDFGNDAQWCSTDPALLTLAAAISCAQDDPVLGTGRPVIGLMNICLNAVSSQPLSNLEEILSHELLHVLVMSEYLFPFYRNAGNGYALSDPYNIEKVECVNDNDSIDFYEISKNVLQSKTERILYNNRASNQLYYELTLPTVTQVVRNQFHCQSLTGARIENQPTNPNSCFGSHLDERFFQYNLMSALYDSTSLHFTPLTLALLEDSGWYKVNYELGYNSPFGIQAGCGFAKEECIVDNVLPDYSVGNFCNDASFEKPFRCDPGHNYRGLCDLYDYNLLQSPPSWKPERQYYTNSFVGPVHQTHSDWCPTIYKYSDSSAECTDTNAVVAKIDNDVEVFGEGSRCMDVSINGGSSSGICIESFCNNEGKQFVFDVDGSSYSCGVGEDGIVKEFMGYGKALKFTCPRLTQACPE